MPLYVGAPVWGLKGWVGNFLPPKTPQREFLRHYSARLNTVEGNTTFYSLPSPDTLARWIAETPAGFRFCLKFPKVISHEKRLQDTDVDTRAFLDCLAGLGQRCGPAFLQLPPGFSTSALPQLAHYLAELPREFRYAVEVRHPGFFQPSGEAALDDLLSKHGVARCIFDTRGLRRADASLSPATREALERKPDFPVRFTRTAAFAFTRFVGHPNRADNFDLLDEWAAHARDWLGNEDDVYFFCHLPDDIESPRLCEDFRVRTGYNLNLPEGGGPNDGAYEQGRLF